MAEFLIEDYTGPVATPSKYLPAVDNLIAAGDGKVGSMVLKDEEEATIYRRDIQAAARERGHTARVVTFEPVTDEKGKATGFKVSIRLTKKIGRKTA